VYFTQTHISPPKLSLNYQNQTRTFRVGFVLLWRGIDLLLDMGTPGSPPTRLTAVPDKWVWPTRRPADLSVGPTDLVGGPHDLLKTFQKIPQMT
jgi:hypothetical protein